MTLREDVNTILCVIGQNASDVWKASSGMKCWVGDGWWSLSPEVKPKMAKKEQNEAKGILEAESQEVILPACSGEGPHVLPWTLSSEELHKLQGMASQNICRASSGIVQSNNSSLLRMFSGQRTRTTKTPWTSSGQVLPRNPSGQRSGDSAQKWRQDLPSPTFNNGITLWPQLASTATPMPGTGTKTALRAKFSIQKCTKLLWEWCSFDCYLFCWKLTRGQAETIGEVEWLRWSCVGMTDTTAELRQDV